MKIIFFLFTIGLFFSFFLAEAQTATGEESHLIEFDVEIEARDSVYLVNLQNAPSLFFFYIISGEPIPELDDRDLFINIVDSTNHGWPVVEAGYIDTRYGVKEFFLDLEGKNFYLMATNGEIYSKVNKFDFH